MLPEGQKKASAEGRSPPQELEEGPRSGPHLLVILKANCAIFVDIEFVATTIKGNKMEPPELIAEQALKSRTI